MPRMPHGSGVLIPRRRLLTKLETAWDHRLTLITAPPGYGKTVLVSQFARNQTRPVAWHTIDERQRDVPTLYTACLSALEGVAPGVEHLTTPYGYTVGDLVALVVDYIREHVNADLLYILDDVHLLAGASVAENWLRLFISMLPSNVHPVLLSRFVPDLPLIEMVARGEILALGQDDLRLTVEEGETLGSSITGAIVPRERVEQLVSRLEGWPAGMSLAFQPLPPEVERAVLGGGEGPEALFGALARSMLNAQSENLREFLLASSTLARLTPVLCGSLLGLRREFFDEVQRRNLFVNHIQGGLVYHALFRSFLQRQLATVNPERFTYLHTKAGEWFETNDQPEDAFDHYLAAGLVMKAAGVAEGMANAYFAQGRVETLFSWALSLGSVSMPRLLYRCAILHTDRYDYPTAEEELRRAEIAFAERGDLDGLADVRLQRGWLSVMHGDYALAIDLVEPLASSRADPANVRGRALNALGMARLHRGEVAHALRCFEEALPLYRAYADSYALAQFLLNVGHAYWRSGRPHDALACLQEVVALRRSLGGAGGLAMALNNLGHYYKGLGDRRQAVTVIQEGLSSLTRSPNRRSESYLLNNLADVQRERGAFSEAETLYDKALVTLGDAEPSLRCTVLTGLSTLYRWRKELPEAITAATQAVSLADQHGIGMEGAQARAVLAAARAASGDAVGVWPDLEAVATYLQERSEDFALLQIVILCGWVALLAGHDRRATECLRQGLDMGHKVGTIQPMVVEILHAPELINLARRQGLREILSAVDELQGDQVTVGQPTPKTTYSLRIYALGRESMLRDGETVDSAALRKLGRDLLLYLVFMGPTSRDELGLLFWPDSSPAKVQNNFHTTVHRLRRLVGENVVVFEDGQYQIGHTVEVWCDAVELEILVGKARHLSARDARTEDLWQRAVSLYRGDFLPSVSADWATAQRTLYLDHYVEALIGLGECARARGDQREALTAFQRASKADPYREDIHRAIMECYSVKGDKHRAVDHFRSWERLLRRDLGLSPSHEMRHFLAALIRPPHR